MRRVRNRYVAEVLDADVQGPSPYIVTRYVPGRTLEDAVRQDGPLRGMALDASRRGAGRGARRHPRGRGGAPRPQAGQRHAGRRPAGDHRLRHRAHTRLHQADQDRPGHGHPGYLAPEVIEGAPSSGGVGRALLGRHRGLRRHRPSAVRQRRLPDDLLPGARGQGGARRDPAAPAAVRHRRAVDRPAGHGRPRAGWPGHSACPGAAAVAATRADAARRPARLPRRTRAVPAAGRAGRVPAPAARPGRVPVARARPRADVADLLPPVDCARGRAAAAPAAAGAGRRSPAGGAQAAGLAAAGLGLLSLAAGVAAVALSVLLPVAGTILRSR